MRKAPQITSIFRSASRWFGAAVFCLLAVGTPLLAETRVRQPSAPEWEVDVTDSLVLFGSPRFLDEAYSIKGEPYAQALSRERRAGIQPTVGKAFVWRVDVQRPASADPEWPVVVEFDESRVVSELLFEDQKLPRPDTAESERWQAGEGTVLLPFTPKLSSGTLIFRAGAASHVYDNGFGRVRLRPATFDELVRLNQTGQGVQVVNRSNRTIDAVLHVRSEDYFGNTLSEDTKPCDLPARQSKSFESLPAASGSYKTRFWITADGKRSWDYWRLEQRGRENFDRDEVTRLPDGWAWQMSPGPLAEHPPTNGWMAPVNLPHRPTDAEWKSHWMWYERTVQIPADWKSERVQLWLPLVRHHAKVYIDGELVAQYPSWELPRRIALPESVKPGTTHQIAIGVTDYIVALAPGVPVPTGGRSDLPSRGLAGPVEVGIGISMVPELLGVPAVRSDWVGVRTSTIDRKSLSASIELQNDQSVEREVNVVTTVLDAGQPIATLTSTRQIVPAGARQTVTQELSSDQFVNWEPDEPKLYELRVELKSDTGQVLDTRRERVGFREMRIDGDHFTLNGHRVNLIGGSHVVAESNIWPARPHPYRLLRNFYPAPPGFISGRITLQLADEMGMFVKSELVDHNALHRDKYAYQLDETWDRVASAAASSYRTMPNHVSNVIWDVGNELWFAGKGEADKMVSVYHRQREADPTRFVVNGGGFPSILDGAELLDWHGWPSIDTRSTYHFFKPEERPAYWKDQGTFARLPVGEDTSRWQLYKTDGPRFSFGWPLTVQGDDPRGRLIQIGNRPILFSEGHYFEGGYNENLTGLSGRVPIANYPVRTDWDNEVATLALGWLSVRQQTIPNMRLSDVAGTMIHVDRGLGRWVQPLVALSVDRKTRFRAGERYEDRFKIINDVTQDLNVTATFTLYDGSRVIGTDSVSQLIRRGKSLTKSIKLDLPTAPQDREYRLHVDVRAAGFAGYFRDDITVTAFGEVKPTLPAGVRLVMFDPSDQTAFPFRKWGVAFDSITSLTDWKPLAGDVLMIGSEALSSDIVVKSEGRQLDALRKLVNGGVQVIVLDHHDLPAFLTQRLTLSKNASGGVYFTDNLSPLSAGLTSRDLIYWRGRDNDWITTRTLIEPPTTGNARVYALNEKGSPLLEIREGSGRVLFCQFNFQAAFGVDPAADRVAANLLAWTATPSTPDISGQTLIVSDDVKFTSLLRGRVGVNGVAVAAPSAAQIAAAKLIIVDGLNPAALRSTESARSAVDDFLKAGGTLYVQNLDEASAKWLSDLIGTSVGVEAFNFDRAWLTGFDPLTAGLTHGSFWWHNRRDNVDTTRTQPLRPDSTGALVIKGSQLRPLTFPAYIGVIERGAGRVLINNTRVTEYPVNRPVALLSTLLSNVGAKLTAGGIVENVGDVAWNFSPIDLSRFANHPIADDPNGRRGWHQSGPDNDMRMFPRGRQDLRGVTYDLLDPEKCNGNGVLALSGTVGRGVLPDSIKGIPVGRKAERLYFLHNSAWGRPGFTYRVYYTEDRKAWIPGKPEPYVDVTVNPNENIADWWGVQAYDHGDAVLTGATVAWMGQNHASRSFAENWVGVFQMVWDNPHAEKEIESIDILSPGTVGNGQVFVFGITAATRKPAEAKTQPTAKVMPPELEPADAFANVANARYGLVVMKDGRIGSIYDRDGTRLFSNGGWSLRGRVGPDADKSAPVVEYDAQSLRAVNLEQSTDATGNTVFQVGPVKAKVFDWTQKITCGPSTVRFEQTFTMTHPWPLADDVSIWSFSSRINSNKDLVHTPPSPNERPAPIRFQTGTATVDFDDVLAPHWFQGYGITREWVQFAPFFGNKPATGAKSTVWYEIAVP